MHLFKYCKRFFCWGPPLPKPSPRKKRRRKKKTKPDRTMLPGRKDGGGADSPQEGGKKGGGKGRANARPCLLSCHCDPYGPDAKGEGGERGRPAVCQHGLLGLKGGVVSVLKEKPQRGKGKRGKGGGFVFSARGWTGRRQTKGKKKGSPAICATRSRKSRTLRP